MELCISTQFHHCPRQMQFCEACIWDGSWYIWTRFFQLQKEVLAHAAEIQGQYNCYVSNFCTHLSIANKTRIAVPSSWWISACDEVSLACRIFLWVTWEGKKVCTILMHIAHVIPSMDAIGRRARTLLSKNVWIWLSKRALVVEKISLQKKNHDPWQPRVADMSRYH
jgi:hypothetical protein